VSHTPGPWRAGKDNYGGIVADHPIEGGVMGTDDVEHYGGYLIAETVAPCNKPLIAAAPELLVALKECAEVIFGNSIADKRTADAFNNANRLIAKAAGGAE
jgi:hypothetical protein